MRDNNEMANLLYNGGYATEEQLREALNEVSPTKDVGQVLLEKLIITPQTYRELIDYVDSIHPENLIIHPDEVYAQQNNPTVPHSIMPEAVVPSPEQPTVEDHTINIPMPTDPHQPQVKEEEVIVSSNNIPNSNSDIINDDTASILSDDPNSIMVGGESLIFDTDAPTNVGTQSPSTEIPVDPLIETADTVAPPVDDSPLIVDINDTVFEPSDGADIDNTYVDMNYAEGEGLVVDLDDVDSIIEGEPVLNERPDMEFFTGIAHTSNEDVPPMPTGKVQYGQFRTHTAQQPAHSKPAEVVEDQNPKLPPSMPEDRIIPPLTIPIPDILTINHSIDEILLYARNNLVSDVHIIPNSPILMRRFGELVEIAGTDLTSNMIENKIKAAFAPAIVSEFEESGDYEFVYTISGGGRYRTTIMKSRSGWTLTSRVIPFAINSFVDAKLPKSALSLTKWAQGLVLVTGPAGCGKSSTLSTLINTINQDRNEHIITIEDPVETIFPMGISQITQRQVGLHTLSQENALRGALRQDPDILMVSELRDMESIKLAVSAAETGHLVFGTMNTTNAIRTINRVIESFPSDEQSVIRNMVSESLRGVISQQLLPKKDGSGMVPAYEVLLVTPAVANMIRKDEIHQLPSAMVTGRNQGMVLLDDSLKDLFDSGIISAEEAYKRANDTSLFASEIQQADNSSTSNESEEIDG